MTLRLNLRFCYFDAIRAGTKTVEYRLASVWEKRLTGRPFKWILLLRGYPKTGDETRAMFRKWNGFKIETITHEHFGKEPVRVLAIDVTQLP